MSPIDRSHENTSGVGADIILITEKIDTEQLPLSYKLYARY